MLASVTTMTMTQRTAPAILIDGVSADSAETAIVHLDDGLVRGDGVFEGLRTYARVLRTPQAHLDRLARSAAQVDIHLDLGLIRDELDRFCEMTVEPDCAVRLMVTRGGQRIFREEPIPADNGGFRLLPVHHRVTPLLIGSKTLSYAANMQAARLARAAGCHDGLFVRADDDTVLEGPTWSLGWIDGDTLVLPPLELGVLDSLTRRIAVATLKTREEAAPVGSLAGADGALILSTVMEARPVAEIHGVATFDPRGAAVTQLIAEMHEATLAAVGLG